MFSSIPWLPTVCPFHISRINFPNSDIVRGFCIQSLIVTQSWPTALTRHLNNHLDTSPFRVQSLSPISLGPKRVPPPTSVPLSTMLVILPQLTSEPPTHRLAALYIRRVSCSAFVCSPHPTPLPTSCYTPFPNPQPVPPMCAVHFPHVPLSSSVSWFPSIPAPLCVRPITGFTSPTVDRSVYIRPPLCAHSFETFMQFAATLP